MSRVCKKCGAEFDKRFCGECQKNYRASYYSRNKMKENIAGKLRYATNPDLVKQRVNKYQKEHPESGRVKSHNYYARKRANGGVLSKNLVNRLFTLQRGMCACGCKQSLGENYELDHRMPIVLGGSNTDDNIQLLTMTCNRQKHAKHPIDFMQERGFLL